MDEGNSEDSFVMEDIAYEVQQNFVCYVCASHARTTLYDQRQDKGPATLQPCCAKLARQLVLALSAFSATNGA